MRAHCPACHTEALLFGLGFVISGLSAGVYCPKSHGSFPHQQMTPSPPNSIAVAVAEMEGSSQGRKERELLVGLTPEGPIAL